MSERSSYNDGEFNWVDVYTPDLSASAEFYGELLGWEFEAGPGSPEDTGGYGMFTYNGKVVAGMGPLMNEGQPVAWSQYVKVSDADQTAAKIKEAGGKVHLDPFAVPEAGRMAVCEDAEGAFFSLWEPDQFQGAELVNEVGSWTWNQLASRDLEEAKQFYGAVFGWDLEHTGEASPDDPYFMWQVEGQRWEEGLAGAMTIGSEMPPDVPPHWQVYFAVPSAEKALETTKARGGAVLFGPQRIPVGTLGVLVDPQGANFAIIEPDYPEGR